MASLNNVELYLGGPTTATPTITSFTLNATDDAAEFIFQVPPGAASYTITRLGFRQGLLTGTAPVFQVSLQGVDASGFPDGTIKNSSNAFFDYTPTEGNENTWQWVTLGATYSAAPGEMLSMVITYESGTIDGSNNCAFTVTSAASYTPGLPYAIQNESTVRTKAASTAVLGWGTAGLPYGQPLEAVTVASFGSASTPDEKALKFTLPAGMGDTFKVAGIRCSCILAAGAAFDVLLYDTNGTSVLQQVSFDGDHDQSPASARYRTFYFDDATLATLNFGSAYRVSVRPTTGNFVLNGITLDSAADQDAYPLGQFAFLSTDTNASGSWSDEEEQRPGIGLILTDITEPAAGGGGLILSPVKVGGF